MRRGPILFSWPHDSWWDDLLGHYRTFGFSARDPASGAPFTRTGCDDPPVVPGDDALTWAPGPTFQLVRAGAPRLLVSVGTLGRYARMEEYRAAAWERVEVLDLASLVEQRASWLDARGWLLELDRDAWKGSKRAEVVGERFGRILRGMLAELPPEEARIVSLYYGLPHARRWTFEEIGELLGTSTETVRARKEQAMLRLSFGRP